MQRTSRNAATDATRAPSFMREQTTRSNIHAGITTAVSSDAVQTKTSTPPRFSPYWTAYSAPFAGCHG